jgi:hypothetical protein
MVIAGISGDDEVHLAYEDSEDKNKTICGSTLPSSITRISKRSAESVKNRSMCLSCFSAFINKPHLPFHATIRMLDIITETQRQKLGYKEKLPAEDRVSFPFIPNGNNSIIRDFIDAKEIISKDSRWSGFRKHNTLFLDAGCGCGNIMLIAAGTTICERIDGIEINKKAVRNANTLLLANPYEKEASPIERRDSEYCRKIFNVMVGDILKFNHYNVYDIIYYYCPFINGKFEEKFETKVEDEMKVGAVIFAYSKRNNRISSDNRFEKIKIRSESHVPIFMKIKE